MGATANFLALGGDSLALLRLLARVAEVFRVEVPLGDLFAAPSLSAMAARITAGSREARQAPPAPPATMGAVAVDTPVPLTSEEHGLWLAHGLEPTSTAYHVGVAWRLEGRLSVPALAAAWAGLVHRQEILRSVFGEDPRDGAPRVRRGSGPIAPLKVVDLSPTLQDAAVVALGAAFVARPFSLRAGPLARALLLRSAPDRWLLVLAFHHLVVDGPSEAILARELGALYGGAQLLPLPSLPSPPQVPARVSAASPGAEAPLRSLPPLPPLPPLALPTDRVPGAAPGRSRRSGSVALPLAPAVPGTPVGGVTPFQGAATALMVLLARWTNTARPWFSTPVTTRFGAALDARVGFFVRTAAVAATVDRDPTLGDLLARVVPRVVAALTAGAPGSVSTGGAAGAAGRDAVVLAVTATAALAMPGLRAERVVLPRQGGWHGRVPLEFQWSIEPGGGVLQLLYDADLFDDTTALRLAAAFRRLVGAVVATPSVRLSAAPWLSPAEEHQLAWEWSRDASTVPGSPDDSALARIAAWGRRTPTATAVAGEFPSWSFERLVGEAATRAAVLRRRLRSPAAASRREPLVAVCGERSPEWVATILGVLGAGAAFLLLDPTAPQRRLRALLRQGGVAGVVVTSGGEGVWAALRGLEIPLWGELAGSGEAEILAKTVPPLDPAALAYVLYTSGSTGQPKGVEIPHRGLVGLMHHQARRFQWGPGSRVLQIAAPCFDAVIAEIFVTLGSGATLVLPSRAAQRPGPAMLETFERQGITAVTLIPSVLAALPRAPLRGVRTLISAGEPCSAAVARRWSPGRTFLNAYGPTEGTVCATVATLTASGVAAQPAARALAVGRPLAHARVYILDAALRPVPAGATGELFLGGTGLARGYRGQPRRTAAAFRPDPFAGPGWEGGRLYATGDLARFRGDGQVEILGRRDDQLKVQGVRIEPAEIEAVLLSHGSVAQAVVAVPVEDTATASRLVAYLVPRPGERIVPEVVRAFLVRRLPTTMVPSVFLEVAALPRTATGKLDRRALPPPPRSAGGRPPSTPTERRLATVWQAVLGLEAVAVEDDFFALGGNSILVLKVVAEARRRGLALTVGQLFEHSTLGALARVLEVPTSRATPRWGVA
jgi:amino acid adenylation domain-containing protein